MSLLQSASSSGIKPSVIVMGLDNTHQPSNFWVSESLTHRLFAFVLYTFAWLFILHGMKAHKVGHSLSIKIGFITGFLLLLLYDFLFNDAITLAVDQYTNRFVKYNPDTQNILLDNKVFKLGKTKGLVMKKSVFDKMKKDKHLKTATVEEFRDSEYVKTLGGSLQEAPMKSYEYIGNLVIGGSYMFITLITACILASHHIRPLLSAMFPFATTSGVLSVALISLWFVDRNYTGLVNTERVKSRVFITAFSFALTRIITQFFL